MPIFTPPSPAGNYTDIGYDLILLVGQSNMAGDSAGAVSAVYDPTHPKVWSYGATGTYAGTIALASDPLAHPSTGSVIVGPGMAFARWYAGIIPGNRRVLLVPAAYNGTAFGSGTPRWDAQNTWPNDATNLYNLAITQTLNALTAAGANARLAAILWSQGESDAIAGMTSTTYRTHLEYLIDGFRSRLSAPTVPFIIGSMTPEFIANNSASTRVAIDAVHQATPTRKAYTAFVQGPSGLGRGDNLHYSPAGHREQGRRMVAALPAAIANSNPASAVAANPPALPLPLLTNTVAPAVTGTPTTGSTLTTTNGTWSATPDSYTYQWTRAGAAISGATASTYVLVTADVFQTVACTVTAIKAGYTSGSAGSNAVTASNGVSISDSFTRADSTSTLGTTETGAATWTALSGTWGINTNRAYISAALSGSLAVVDTASANHAVQGVITVGDGGSSIVGRCTDLNNWVALTMGAGASSYTIYRRAASVTTAVTITGSNAAALGDTMKLVLNGSTGTVFRNGTQVATFTNSDTGTKVGIRADTTAARHDDFLAVA